MNATMNDQKPWRSEYRGVFKRSWSRTDWLRKAHKEACAVQVLVPKLDLRKACEVWVRNHATRGKLESMGFTNVIVKRLPNLGAQKVTVQISGTSISALHLPKRSQPFIEEKADLYCRSSQNSSSTIIHNSIRVSF
jgi:hypothetical protein